jgi:proline racemase
MLSRKCFAAVDSHTEGMPTRVITSGVGVLPGATMAEKRTYLMRECDNLRTLLMYEPRGHASMSGAILQPACRDGADYGVVFIDVSGCIPMCGHGTIGVATVLTETGMVAVREPVTTIRLDTPVGLIEARVEVENGRARSVTIQNVPSYLHLQDAGIDAEGYGELTVDLAWGGAFFAIIPAKAVGLDVTARHHDDLVMAGQAVMTAVNDQLTFAHPHYEGIRECHHVIFTGPGEGDVSARGATSIHPGWIDRSPCGTGTSARMAQLHARGELALDEDFVHASLIGSRFTGRLVTRTTVGEFPAVLPTVRGRAWVTGLAHYLLDPGDPFPRGFLIQDQGAGLSAPARSPARSVAGQQAQRGIRLSEPPRQDLSQWHRCWRPPLCARTQARRWLPCGLGCQPTRHDGTESPLCWQGDHLPQWHARRAIAEDLGLPPCCGLPDQTAGAPKPLAYRRSTSPPAL